MLNSQAYDNLYNRMVWPFWIAFLSAAALAYPVFRTLLALRSRQTVSQYAPEGHQKKQGTPTMGGLIIICGLLVWWVSAMLGAHTEARDAGNGFWLWTYFILVVGFAGIGFLDDFVVPRMTGKRGLGWKQKIVMQLLVAVVAVGTLLGWTHWDEAAAYVFLILFVSNAYNFLDGLDALAGSVLVPLCCGLLALGQLNPLFGEPWRALLHALIGATLPFLFLNAPPAKVFMGDVGSLPIGALLGLVFSDLAWPALTAHSGVYNLFGWSPEGHVQTHWILPLIVLGLVLVAELVPVPMQIFWVKVFKRKLFPYTPIHHAFERAGWPESRVVWTFLLTQVIASVAAYTILTQSAFGAISAPGNR